MNHSHLRKVAFAHSVGVIGGAERVSLAAMGGVNGRLKPLLLSPVDGPLHAAAVAVGADPYDVDSSCYGFTKPAASAKMLFRARRVLADDVRLLHVGDITAFRGLSLVARFCDIPTVCHVHYPYPESFLRWVFTNSPDPNVFVFCSAELQLAIGPMLALLCPLSRQEVIHNGVDTDVFVPRDRSQGAAPGSKRRVGIVANLQERKGHEDFLHMAALLRKRGYDLTYEIVGGDILEKPRQPFLENLAKDLGLTDSVVFHGQVDNVLELIQELDVLVCASHEEAFPISMLEAMATQVPIVSTNVNGIPEALSDGYNALLTEPHNAERLAECVGRILDDTALAEVLAKNARESVVDRFSERVFVSKVMDLYETIWVADAT